MIYIVRNPKSSVPSLFRVLEYIKNSQAKTLREFMERFLTDKDCLYYMFLTYLSKYVSKYD